MRLIFLISLLTSLITFEPLPKLPIQDDAQKAAKAQELLKQCRSALGSEKVKSLAIAGTYRQKMGEMEMGGDLELEMVLPDKFYKASVMSPMGGMEITRLEVLNGATAWLDTQNNAPAGGHVVFRMGTGPNANAADAQKAQQLFIRQEWTRLLLGLLGQAPTSVPLEYSYAGEAEAPDGVADVIEVKSKDIGFAAQLFLDQKTHRPLMLTYQGRKPMTRMITRQIASGDTKKKTPEELEKEMQAAREKAQAQAAAEPLVEIQLRYEDFSTEGGVTLPHRISRTIDGQITEEWALTKFKINPNIKADKFEKK
ncbi:MAG TPA: hypothetical protein VFZ34_30645 [Blastocatellia bacterium]|nr:hypothetical protein [Blastocatellia bacterium]